MTHHAETTIRVKAAAETVWETLQDFSSIERFSSKVDTSPVVGAKSGGLGAQRKCTFYDKSTVVEEIVEYEEGKGFRIELSGYSMPLKSLQATMEVTPTTSAKAGTTCKRISQQRSGQQLHVGLLERSRCETRSLYPHSLRNPLPD